MQCCSWICLSPGHVLLTQLWYPRTRILGVCLVVVAHFLEIVQTWESQRPQCRSSIAQVVRICQTHRKLLVHRCGQSLYWCSVLIGVIHYIVSFIPSIAFAWHDMARCDMICWHHTVDTVVDNDIVPPPRYKYSNQLCSITVKLKA